MECCANALEKAVHRQLMSDVPYGVLLSGGLDSSVISAITKKLLPGVLRLMTARRHGGRSCIHLQWDWRVLLI